MSLKFSGQKTEKRQSSGIHYHWPWSRTTLKQFAVNCSGIEIHFQSHLTLWSLVWNQIKAKISGMTFEASYSKDLILIELLKGFCLQISGQLISLYEKFYFRTKTVGVFKDLSKSVLLTALNSKDDIIFTCFIF